MTKYTYRPERLTDPRLTDYMAERIHEHAQQQWRADRRDFGFKELLPNFTIRPLVRIIIEAAMIEYPTLFTPAGDTLQR